MNTAVVPVSRWSVPLLLLIAVGLSIGVFVYARILLRQNRIDAGIFFGGAIPSRLETLMAVRVEGGEVGEFFDAATKQKLSMLLVTRPNASEQVISVPNVIALIDKYRLAKEDLPEVNRIILKYAAAQFDVLAAGNIAPTEIPLAGTGVAAQRFETTKGAHYLMGVLNLERQQLLFLALKKGENVDSQAVGELLEKVPGVTKRIAVIAR